MAHQKDGDRSSDVGAALRVVGLLACFGLLAAACLEQKILAGALAGALSLLPAIQEALSELGERSWNLQKSLPYTECYFNITEGSRKKKSAVLTLNDRLWERMWCLLTMGSRDATF